MNDDLSLLALHESAARVRLSTAARDLRSSLTPTALARRAVRARPWSALVVAGVAGVAIGAWLSGRESRPTPSRDRPAAAPSRGWIEILSQVGRVVAAVIAAKAAHTHVAADHAHV